MGVPALDCGFCFAVDNDNISVGYEIRIIDYLSSVGLNERVQSDASRQDTQLYPCLDCLPQSKSLVF